MAQSGLRAVIKNRGGGEGRSLLCLAIIGTYSSRLNFLLLARVYKPSLITQRRPESA